MVPKHDALVGVGVPSQRGGLSAVSDQRPGAVGHVYAVHGSGTFVWDADHETERHRVLCSSHTPGDAGNGDAGSDDAVTCDTSSWPDVDNGVVCGACRVLVDRYDSQYGTCSNYCAAVGRECVWAAEEEGDSCAVQYESSCTLPIGNGTTSDALCECGTHSSDVTFVALPSCTHACTTQPTTCAELL